MNPKLNRKFGLILTVLLALFLTACAGKKKDVVAVEDPNANQTGAVEANEFGNRLGIPGGYSDEDLRRLGITENPLNYKVVYFEYNSSVIDERSQIIIDAHARNLANLGGAQVSLEGHADERGTRDYNLALGERRAQQVGQRMNANGARSSIQSVSFGEERPVDSGHTEAAWRQNRRVEIKY